MQQQHVQQGGQHGVAARPWLLQFTAEQVNGGPELRVVADTGREMDDLRQVAEQRLCTTGRRALLPN